MRPALQQIALIEQYLEGKLEGEVLYNFNRRLKADPEFRASVEQQRQLMEGIQYLGLKNELDNIHKDLYGRFNWWRVFGIGIIVLALGGLGFFLTKTTEQHVIRVEEKPSKNTLKPHFTLKKDDSLITAKETEDPRTNKIVNIKQASNYELPQQELTTISEDTSKNQRKKTVLNPSKPQKNENHYQPVTINPLFYPDTQSITFWPHLSNTIVTKGGIEIEIPAYSFGRDNPVDSITLSLIEIFEKSDYVKFNLPTITTDGIMLQSGGMVFLEAQRNDTPIEMRQGAVIQLRFPIKSSKRQKEMKPFHLQEDSLGQRTWNVGPKRSMGGTGGSIGSSFIQTVWSSVKSPFIRRERPSSLRTKPLGPYEGAFYAINIAKLGWINCDRFYKLSDQVKTDVSAHIQGNDSLEYTHTYLVFHKINSVLAGTYINENQHYVGYGNWPSKHQCTFIGVPLFSQVTVVAIGGKGDSLFYGQSHYVIEKGKSPTVNLQAIPKAELEKNLKALNNSY